MGSLDRLKDISGFMAGFPLDDTLGSATTRAIGGMLGTIAMEIEREREQSAGCGSCADAAEWVEQHGGLDAVIERWAGSVPAAHVQNLVAGWKEKRERLTAHVRRLEHLLGERRSQIKQLHSAIGYMSPRLLPDGMEWPRFEDGEPVEFGDKGLDIRGEVRSVNGVKFTQGGFVFISDDMGRAWWANDQGPTEDPCVDPAKRVKRPALTVLDSDGVEIRVGDVLYSIETGDSVVVESTEPGNPWFGVRVNAEEGELLFSGKYTHRAPVFAADGKPLREGETVWSIGCPRRELVVLGQPGLGGGTGRFKVVCHDVTDGVDRYCDPSHLTHERPDSLGRLADDIGAMVVAWRSNRDLFDAQEAAAGCVGENTLGAALDSIARRVKTLAERGQ